MEQKKNLLIGVSGSVATIKLADIVENLLKTNFFNIRIVTTEKAFTFVDEISQEKLSKIEIFSDKDEWGQWKKKGDPVLHVDLRKWADIFIIAPLSANTLSKISNGGCDNLLTCIARAWDFSIFENKNVQVLDETYKLLKKPFIVAPAMNTYMFDVITNLQDFNNIHTKLYQNQHPITEKQIRQLKDWNIIIIPTVEKILVCGDKGLGAMAEVITICDLIKDIKNQLESK